MAESARAIAPNAVIVRAASEVRLDDPGKVKGKRVIVVDDGPTITHGGMAYGAGYVAAVQAGADNIVDPRPFAKGDLIDVYARFPHIGKVLPAMGYSTKEMTDLAATAIIAARACRPVG